MFSFINYVETFAHFENISIFSVLHTLISSRRYKGRPMFKTTAVSNCAAMLSILKMFAAQTQIFEQSIGSKTDKRF